MFDRFMVVRRTVVVVLNCLITAATLAMPAMADTLKVGNICIDQYDSFKQPSGVEGVDVGGADFLIHYSLNDNFSK